MQVNVPLFTRFVESVQTVNSVEDVTDNFTRFEIIFATSAPYSRGNYLEVLSMQHADLSLLLENRAPVLINHDQRELPIAVIEKRWVSGENAHAVIKFSNSDRAKQIVQDIKDGILPNISVGYAQTKLISSTDETPPVKQFAWRPFEVSIVTLPADYSAKFIHMRSMDTMEENEVSRDAWKQEEMQRINSIFALAKSHGVEVDESILFLSQEAAKTAILEKKVASLLAENATLVKGTSVTSAPVNTKVSVGEDGLNRYAQDLLEIATQSGSRSANYRQNELSLKKIAKNCLILGGMSEAEVVRMDDSDIAKYAMQQNQFASATARNEAIQSLVRNVGAHSITDFPNLLGALVNKVIVSNYNGFQDTWSRWCRIGNVPDFKNTHRLKLSGVGNLLSKLENGEYVAGILSDAETETVKAATKGRHLIISREMIINDELNVLQSMAEILGTAAARTIEADVYSLLLSGSGAGPTMADGNALFSVAHNNLAGTPAAVSHISFAAAYEAMAKQTDKQGNILAIKPMFILSSMQNAWAAAALLESEEIRDNTSNAKFAVRNPMLGVITRDFVVGSPYVTGTNWYLVADPKQAPAFEVAFLNGNTAPTIESETSLGGNLKYLVRHDYGIAAIDYRGIYRNAGA